jgi:O-antigen/teichoic acid export membrane protein
MSKIRSLAGQTVSYGVSSILARILNYALVPLHTSIFSPAEFGTISGLYAFAAFMNILLTFGMETTYFRFATKTQDESVYSTAATMVISFSIIVCGVIYLFRESVAASIGYADDSLLVGWLAIIVFIDAAMAIPFARLRLENKVGRFVFARVTNITIIVILNILFLWIFPGIESGKFLSSLATVIEPLYNPELRIGYVFLANLIASASLIILLWSPVSKIRLQINQDYLRPMLIFTLPILLTGFAGTLNDQLDKILIPLYMTKADLGVYSAVFKLSIFMVLATQAFRYAGEPFFFSNAENKEAPELFARVLYYFVIVSVVIYLGVCLNMDLLAFVFIRDEAMRAALYLLPILLMGKLFYGIYINVSIWFKIKDKTYYGTIFALVGASITILVNITLIPVIGYLASALACLVCYLVMCTLAYIYGKRFFPVPYKLIPAFIYLAAAILIVYLSMQIKLDNFWYDSGLNILAFILITGLIFIIEKRKWNKLSFD